MKRIEALLTEETQQKVTKAIRGAEAKTSAEIVPMIVWQSSPVFHVWPILFLVFGLFSSFVFPLIPIDMLFPLHAWHVAGSLFFCSVFFSWCLSKIPAVQNFLTPDVVEAQLVYQRAVYEFYQLQMEKTLAQTGVLLFVSARERRAVVLADKSISSKVDKKIWDEIIERLTVEAYKSSMTEGLVQAIELTGSKLSQAFPRSEADINELPDKLILKP